MIARQTPPSIIGLLVRSASALALVIAITVSPIRRPSSANRPSGQDSFSRDSICSAKSPARVSVTNDQSRPVRLKALSSENEEKEFNETGRHASGTFDGPTVSSPKLFGESLISGPALAVHPLRC